MHTQDIPERVLGWEHSRFFGRRIGTPDDANPADEAPTELELQREWGITDMQFASVEDSVYLRNPLAQVEARIRGELVDRFFYDAEGYGLDRSLETLAESVAAELAEAEEITTETVLAALQASLTARPGYQMTDLRVLRALRWMFSSQPTEEELARTQDLAHARAAMAGTVLFPGPYQFTVTEIGE